MTKSERETVITATEKEQIIREICLEGKINSQVAKLHGITISEVKNILHSAGVGVDTESSFKPVSTIIAKKDNMSNTEEKPVKKRRHNLSKDFREHIKRALLKYFHCKWEGFDEERLCKEFDISSSTLRRIANEAGLKFGCTQRIRIYNKNIIPKDNEKKEEVVEFELTESMICRSVSANVDSTLRNAVKYSIFNPESKTSANFKNDVKSFYEKYIKPTNSSELMLYAYKFQVGVDRKESIQKMAAILEMCCINKLGLVLSDGVERIRLCDSPVVFNNTLIHIIKDYGIYKKIAFKVELNDLLKTYELYYIVDNTNKQIVISDSMEKINEKLYQIQKESWNAPNLDIRIRKCADGHISELFKINNSK